VSLDERGWSAATPAPGWNVADQVRHLALSERAACLALAGRGAEVFAGKGAGLAKMSQDVLGEWRTAREESLLRFSRLDDRDKVIWGAGPMTVRSFADSRLMETWAHGLDCFAAVSALPVDTVRLRRIAAFGLRTLPYAFSVAGMAPPGDPRAVALDLRGPAGERWWLGPADSTDLVKGTAGDWCRVATRRLAAKDASLEATSPLAAAAIGVARTYLAD
jgi:enediyne biosynthesis protein E11